MWISGIRPKPVGQRFYVALLATALVAAVGFADHAAAQALSTDDAARRDEAVVAARDGDYVDAIATLETLGSRYPLNLALAHDRITVLAWSGDAIASVDLAEALNPVEAPRYAQIAVAKAARDVQRFEVAAEWYDAAVAQDPQDMDAQMGRVMTAGDAQDGTFVNAFIERNKTVARDNPELLLAEGYALRVIGDYLPALSIYDSFLETEPTHQEALRGQALILRSMLLPTQALALATRHPGILSEAEMERLRADEAAIHLRITARTPYPEESVYQGTDSSLEAIYEQIRRY
jgi:biofilm PGA synthesis protein PgaA